MDVFVDPTTRCFTPEETEEIVHLKTEKDSAENRPLSNTITRSEDVGKHTIPSDVGKLKHVNDYEDSKESWRVLN